MKVTSDLLLNYGAPDAYIQYIDDNYKSEVELDELFAREDTPIDLLHFVVKYWKMPPAPYTNYLNKCQIVSSEKVYESEDIADSLSIVSSKHISDSNWVQNSINVEGSENVYGSEKVKDSKDVWNSQNVTNSFNIIASKNIISASEVLYSDNISWSHTINCSNDVSESIAIYKSSHVLHSFFCGFCENISNSLFCINQTFQNYQMFNAPVDPLTFERTLEELTARLQNENFNFIRVDESGYYPQQRYINSVRFDSMFKNLSPEFYGWIGTLPNYSEEVFLRLFFK